MITIQNELERLPQCFMPLEMLWAVTGSRDSVAAPAVGNGGDAGGVEQLDPVRDDPVSIGEYLASQVLPRPAGHASCAAIGQPATTFSG